MESWGYFLAREWGSKDGISVVWVRIAAGGTSVAMESRGYFGVMESRGRGVNEISVVWARIEGWG